jgi:Ca2+-binding RTX toxin-like protein
LLLVGLVLAATLAFSASPAAAKRSCAGNVPTILGTPLSDTIEGTRGDDVIRAGAGSDLVEASAGDDIVCAGPGDDVADGGSGADLLRGGVGSDRLRGDEDDDELVGLGGTDSAEGGSGTDSCLAEAHAECEAALTVGGSGSTPPTAGDSTVFNGSLYVENQGPTAAVDVYAAVALPEEAEFVAGSSDPRCVEVTTDRLACAVGALDVHARPAFQLDFRFPDCPPTAAGFTATFSASAEDSGTNNPRPAGAHGSLSMTVKPAASCPAV